MLSFGPSLQKKGSDDLEHVQRRAFLLLNGIEHESYEELGLLSLEEAQGRPGCSLLFPERML